MNLKDRFLNYVSFDTQSDTESTTYPSSAKQLVLLNHLKEELLLIGLKEVDIDENGYVTATLPATIGFEDKPTIGFIAHVDTSPDMTGKDIHPQIIENYDGNDIPLNSKLALRVSDFPELLFFKGHTLITTDGTTLLGADDKAGVAEIVTAVEYLMKHPEIKHGKIRIGFTPDEEIGKGVDYFNVSKFGAKYAYTVDGGFEGELEYENFNAAALKISVQGANIHPGYAKDKMQNATLIAIEFNSMLPPCQRPEHTEGYEGFYHLIALNGGVENATAEYIIRDHSSKKFQEKKDTIYKIADFINKKYGQDIITVSIADQYYNMKEMIEPHPEIIEKALEAMKEAEVTPIVRPIRGGTDGARLSFMGLPCPNLFTGGMNFHGKFEYCSLNSMQKSVDTIINLIILWGK